MEGVNYPTFREHARLHDEIIREMNSIMRQSPSLNSLVYKLKRLLKSWMTGHIQQQDKQVCAFLRRQEEQQEREAARAATPVEEGGTEQPQAEPRPTSPPQVEPPTTRT